MGLVIPCSVLFAYVLRDHVTPTECIVAMSARAVFISVVRPPLLWRSNCNIFSILFLLNATLIFVSIGDTIGVVIIVGVDK